MPAFNASSTISDSIASVLKQDWKNWELIIVNDFSSDKTLEIINGFSAKDPRIKVISNFKNLGPAESRNVAIEKSKGCYLAFLDSDDMWMPQKLSRAICFSIANNYYFVFTAYKQITNDGLCIGRFRHANKKVTYRQLLKSNSIATSTVFLNVEILGKPLMPPIYYDDFGCWLSILKNKTEAYGLDEDLMRYRVTKGSLSRNKFKSANKVWKIYRGYLKLSLRETLVNFFFYVLFGILKNLRF